MNHPIKIMLVEDQPEYRDAIKLAFNKTSSLHLISMHATAEKALLCLRRDQPDIILLDLNLLGMNGIDAIYKLRESAPNTKVIVLTSSMRENDIIAAISGGAAGYLLKCASLDQIIDGINIVMKGGASLDPKVAKMIMENIPAAPYRGKAPLSQRKLEILSLIAEGLVKKEIADRLNISYSTVDSYVKDIYEALQVNNAPSAVNKAHHLGLLRRNKND